MIRGILYLFTLAALLSGCSKKDTPAGRELGFDTRSVDDDGKGAMVQARSTGGTIVNSNTLKQAGNLFKVYSTYMLPGREDRPVFDKQPEEITYTGSTWTYSPKKTWINSARYKFRAYFPPAAHLLEGSTTVNQLVIEYNILRDNFDLLVAYAERYPADPDQGYGPVTMSFQHALSALRFEIKYSEALPEGTTDRITKAHVENLGVVGMMTFNGTPKKYKIEWREPYLDPKPHYPWEGSKEFGRGEENKVSVYDQDGIVFAIPQVVQEGKTSFTFFTKSGGDHPHVVKIPAITWVPGKIYTYSITLTGSSVDVLVTIKEWKTIDSNLDIHV